MHIDALLAGIPAPVDIDAAEVRESLDPRGVLVVLDDDPTGTQSVANLPVLTRWENDDLAGAFATGAPAVYVLTNTRSLDEQTAAERNREVVAVALAAASDAGLHVTFVSRGDSTLRGHFPLETDVLSAEIVAHGGSAPQLTLLVPAFPDAGRITVNSVHYWVTDGEATPVGETPFAQDATFGYSSSNLRDWVEEKTDGRVAAADVAALTIDIIRSGVEAVAAFLRRTPDGSVVAVDVVDESDMRVVALALHAFDREVLLRVGPPYVRAHIGQEIAEPVSAADIPFAYDRGGLVVVGSHVPLTTAQLDELRRQRPDTVTIELDVRQLIDARRDAHLDAQAHAVAEALASGSVIVHTTRELITGADGEASLEIARRVSSGVVELVRRVLAITPPRFVIAKGGITSSDVASEALEIRRATVLGPMLPGLVSLWQPQTGPAVGIPYIVFAGNVGDTDSLARVVSTLADANGDSKGIVMTTTVAVIGLGAMGLPMATRLAERFEVRGFDIAEARIALASEKGVKPAASAAEAVADAQAVLVAVRTGAQLNDLLFGETGLASHLAEGAVVILTSTVGTDGIGEIADQLAAHGAQLVDAPLSGGPVRAGEGDLLIVVGAAESALTVARPVLDQLASTLSIVGDKPGDGQALKTVNQLLCGVHIAAAAEALALADALGLDREKTLEALTAGAANSFMLGNRGPRSLQAYDEDGAEVLSRLDIFVKDMGIVGTAARAAHLSTPVANAAEQLFLLGEAQGLGAHDDSAVIRVIAPERLS